MPSLYAVTRSHGVGWKHSLALEQQSLWREHADFMNALECEGFVLLGGPLEGTEEALLIVRAESVEEIGQRLAGDPWSESKQLVTTRVARWDLRLGTVG